MKELTKLQTCICDIKAVIRCSQETHTKIVLEEVVENLEAVALEVQVQKQTTATIDGKEIEKGLGKFTPREGNIRADLITCGCINNGKEVAQEVRTQGQPMEIKIDNIKITNEIMENIKNNYSFSSI